MFNLYSTTGLFTGRELIYGDKTITVEVKVKLRDYGDRHQPHPTDKDWKRGHERANAVAVKLVSALNAKEPPHA